MVPHESVRARIARLMQTDFCPNANKYVYWLKEPVGWLVTATAASVLVGLYVSSVGWVLAGGLSAIIVVGCLFPWIAVRAAVCTLQPKQTEIDEGEPCELQLAVRNRLPLPLIGLTIEGFFTSRAEAEKTDSERLHLCDDRPETEIALAAVAPLSRTWFRLPIAAKYRGRYPKQTPTVACSFPFGIWTARRPVADVESITVWPHRIESSESWELPGARRTHAGDGHRVGDQGDLTGVRPFRRGDRLRSIHWAQTARSDALVVCERSAPEQPTVDVVLDASPLGDNRYGNRDHVAWRVRLAATLILVLHARRTPVRLCINGRWIEVSQGARGRSQILDALAEIPLDGSIEHVDREPCASARANHPTIEIRRLSAGELALSELAHQRHGSDRYVLISMNSGTSQLRSAAPHRDLFLDLHDDMSDQLDHFLREVNREVSAA